MSPRLDDPPLRELLHDLLKQCDRTPLAERSQKVSCRLTPKHYPRFFNRDAETQDYAWRQLEQCRAQGWVEIDFKRRPDPERPAYESAPRIVLKPEGEAPLREALDHPAPSPTYAKQWADAVARYADCFAGDTEPMAATPIAIEGWSADAIVARLIELPVGEAGRLYIRELSARLFNGLSKVLDTPARRRAVLAAAGLDENAFPERPIIVHAHVPATGAPILLLENETTYHAALRDGLNGLAGDMTLVWCAGYRGTARRLRQPQGAHLHIERSSHRRGVDDFIQRWLDADCPLEACFFGDLDFAAMRILRELRQTIPDIAAWQPGYRRLLTALEQGIGHTPAAAGKTGQEDPTETGCQYADTVLLPALRRHGIFVDQEWLG